jgi:peptide/nickel transport system ATP-binding protein
VDGVSLRLDKGETLAIVGESGCGKTVVGWSILRLIEPTSGEILFKGLNIMNLRGKRYGELKRKMQIIFQNADSSLDPRMSVRNLITEPFRANRIFFNEDTIRELMEKVDLNEELLERYPHELSGGQRQRIGVARAIALKPELIVADEPASSLDFSVQAQILYLLKKIQRDYGVSYLFISHNLNIVRMMADRIAVMNMGKIVEMGRTEDIFERSAHPYTQALLSAIPAIGSDRRKRIILKGEMPSQSEIPKGCRFHTRCPLKKRICETTIPTTTEISSGHCVSCHLVCDTG